jgi:outer membrane protein OmpA-like peptidoglycan-associated protein
MILVYYPWFTIDPKNGDFKLNRKAAFGIRGVAVILLALLLLPPALAAQDEPESAYTHVADELSRGVALQEVADNAYDNADDYWTRDPGPRDGEDEELSAGEAVTRIYISANQLGNVDAPARDIVRVTDAVVDAWPDCEDTFDAVRAAVTLEPQRADEIVADVAYKRDCNCHNGGIWLDQRVLDRVRVEMRHSILEVPFQCSCSQIAMYAGIAGLPENREWDDTLPEAEKQALIDRMAERVVVITERTAAQQSLNSWDCGCTDINIAASMQGIEADELRDGTFDALADRYSQEAGDTGLVVDAFGIVGTYPENHWGSSGTTSRENDLRREGEIYRGDNLILDPFDPDTEYDGFGDRNFADLGQHTYSSPNIPTDVFISEYLEGWNDVSLQLPPAERDPEQRNRVIELYNGGEETIDLGNGQYVLEIYGGGGDTRTIVTPPALIKKTISLQSDVTFEFDQADIRAEASEDLQEVIGVLNEADVFSEILISGHTCDLGPDTYNLALSQRRADSVRNFLQANGLKDVPIRTEGLGEARPRLPNSSDVNRARNRRVDITFVTREGEEIETTVSQDDAGNDVREYTFMVPIPPTVHEIETDSAGGMAAGEYSSGDMNPREVIGLNGAVEPGETWIIAYSESDDPIKDRADVVTAQLDFQPNETLVVRRLGGEMALNCRAQSYAYLINFEADPLLRFPQADDAGGAPPPDDVEIASPN